ncbi:hypothetical protein WKI68_35420 [Streptomyces sp. MS1.HAVA.3]|uniref:Uncharacterized protein n=1 Tax=Streptomyces caledonius TaxID=3134107 RepID=A0ABU8UB10_9ACTN
MASHRRPLALALLATAVVLVAGVLAACLWGGSDGGLVLLSQLRGHVVAMGWLTLVSLLGAILLGVRHRGRASLSGSRWPGSAS